ncbi:glycosyltransferase family 2 protein [Pontibacter qinzhouensis]|uniref:Glycosyltransferase family 2 protein n=1 Tax=Pontibacter qinzhouensis TaxID=2603253 RepID=A0A5C8KCV5_9BACT|nr:glycosyltransferase family 2 protein [Pontibacter qinzhouensis]TXK52123.1 glycosyltransferase family 2 protein [Pontibacter qinzhouensis]
MKYLLQNPTWLNNFNFPYERLDQVPEEIFEEVNRNLDTVLSKDPVVSIIIAAFNEEVNVLRCIASLSRMKTTIPFEIIVVNNNSKDRTQETLNKLHVRSLFETRQGCGPARQLGQENAKGKYVLLGDADCFYSEHWINEMLKVLQQPGVVCVYGRYSFISEPGFPRWQLAIFEKMKDVIAEFRHIHRPYFNAYGISMGYVKEYGLKVGFIKTKFWGDDGKLCLDLMAYGKIKQVKATKARAWTGTRTLQRSGSFAEATVERIKKELNRLTGNFSSEVPFYDPNDPKFNKS